ncbi:MAG: isoprenylcysteine carboxylmethyltransferase family protein [Ignavibacteriales bacterium]|nr:isoprenylcysteine carboxylmethyltransferase family protein [Ignavibacteriales bacterium]
MLEIKIFVFIISSIGILFLSWKSLRNRKSHGFYRFFAFELILLNILKNIDWWFVNPFSILQIISWLLLFTSIYFVVTGFYLLKKIGKPKGKIENSANFGFENTSNLVTTGIYNYIRHPLYASLLLLSWGTFLKNITEVGAIILILISIFLTLTAEFEEKENKTSFGDEYLNYMKKTKMFIPFIF